MSSVVAEDLISLEEAKLIVGVSEKTLLRFAEAGYLKTCQEDCSPHYLKSELAQIFGIKETKIHDFNTAVKNLKAQETTNSSIANAPLEEPTTTTIIEDTPRPSRPLNTVIDKTVEFSVHEKTNITTSSPLTDSSLKNRELEQDIKILKAVSELNEKLLDIKDKEITDLKSQRDWLQKRVEQMEEKANRDQLILLTETQVLNKMLLSTKSLTHPNKNNGPIRKALDWLGIGSNNSSTNFEN